jgi:hypothetical protein
MEKKRFIVEGLTPVVDWNSGLKRRHAVVAQRRQPINLKLRLRPHPN